MIKADEKNSPFILISTFITGLLLTHIIGSAVIGTQGLTIEPNHDKPCVVGDAWAEECMSCVCSEGRIATCRPSFCAARLKRDLDDCKEGEVTKIDCNTCQCKKNIRVCTKYDCYNKSVDNRVGNGDLRHNRKYKRRGQNGKRIKRKV